MSTVFDAPAASSGGTVFDAPPASAGGTVFDDHKVRSPYATGPFADKSKKTVFDTSGFDAVEDAQRNAFGQAITKPAAGAFNLLQRVPDAWDATLTGGNPGNVLTGSATDEDKAATQRKVSAALARFPGGSNAMVREAYHIGMNPLNLVDVPLGAAAKGRSLGQLATDAAEGQRSKRGKKSRKIRLARKSRMWPQNCTTFWAFTRRPSAS